MAITVQGDTFTGSVGTPWNIPAGVAIFVQPGSGGKVIDYDTTRQNYMSMYGVDPLGQVQPNQNASPGSANYEMSRTYYSNNPSQQFQDLNAQYQQQQGNTLTFGMYSSSGISRQSTSEPTPVYDMSTAAGIAAYTARQGGTVTADTARIAFQEGYIGSLNVVSGMSTVLIPDKAALAQGNALTIPASVLPGSTVTTYVPYGSYAQTELLNTKDIINQISGEIGIYQLSKGGYYYKLIGGGGIGSLQSGMFTIGSPETPVVYTQESAGKVLAASANATGAAYVLANESAYSRLGAEVYGGYVTKLTGATVESTGAQLSTYANQFNLANYVSPTGVNLSKADMNLFSLPWTISPNTSAVMVIGKEGNVTGLQLPAGVEETFTPSTQVAAIGPTIITKSDATQEIGGLTFTLLGTAENVLGTGTKAAAEQAAAITYPSPFVSSAKTSEQPKTSSVLQTISNDVEAWEGFGVSVFDSINSMLGLGTPGKNVFSNGQSPATIFYETKMDSLTRQYSDLTSQLSAENTQINSFAAGNVVNGKWVGSEADYATYKAEIEGYNTKVATASDLYSQIETLQSGAIQSGVLIQQPGGKYAINTALDTPYGQFSLWSQGASKVMQDITGVNAQKFAAYEQTPDYTVQHWYSPVTNVLYGTFKQEVLNPGQVATSVGTGAVITAAFIGGGELIGAGAAAAGAGDAGILATTAARISSIGEFPVYTSAPIIETIGVAPTVLTIADLTQLGLVAVPAGLQVYEASGGFKYSAQQTEVNLGASLPNLAGMIVGGAAVAYSPAGFTRLSNEYTERMTTTRQLNYDISYEAIPSIRSESGVTGGFQYTESYRVLEPTTFNVLGREITLPRLTTPEYTIRNVDLSEGDIASLLNARLGGTEAYPISGSRSVRLELSYRPGEEVATGVGTLTYGEVKLPLTFSEYMNMAKSDLPLYKGTGISQEELAQSYMSNAMATTPRVTGVRPLDVTVNIGTDIRDAFNYNFAELEGTTHQFNRVNLNEYFGRLSFEQSGGALPEYSVNVIRDMPGVETGNIDITNIDAIRTPEERAVTYLQELSRNMGSGQNEAGFVFNSEGRIISEVPGSSTSVDFSAEREFISKTGEDFFGAHSHPYTPGSDLLLGRTRISNTELMKLPSGAYLDRGVAGDIEEFAQSTIRAGQTLGNLIVSKEGVTIFRPTAGGSWANYWDLLASLPPERTMGILERTGSTDEIFAAMRDAGIDVQFVRNTEAYGPQPTARTTTASQDMLTYTPEFVENQFMDVLDRMVLNNPNLEFTREIQTREPSLSESGSNLGRGGGGIISGGAGGAGGSQNTVNRAPSAQLLQAQYEAIAPLRETATKETVRAAEPDNVFTTPINNVKTTGRENVIGFSVPESANVWEFAESTDAAIMTAVSPITASISTVSQVQEPSQKSDLEIATAFDIVPATLLGQESEQKSDLDKIIAYDIISSAATISATEQENEAIITPALQSILETAQIVQPVQIPDIDQVPEYTPTPEVPIPIEPIPDIPVFPIFQLPWGQGGSGGSLKRRRKYLEYFPVGLDISSFGITKGSNPFTSPVGERKYYPVESYGLPRESKTPRAYKPPAQRKAPKLKRRRTNIFF